MREGRWRRVLSPNFVHWHAAFGKILINSRLAPSRKSWIRPLDMTSHFCTSCHTSFLIKIAFQLCQPKMHVLKKPSLYIQRLLLGSVYTERQRQRCKNASDTALIENIKLLEIGVATHFGETP